MDVTGLSPKARAAHREVRAVELLMAGRDYDQIAVELGYANRSGAWRAVQRALRKRRDVLAGEHLQLELERLDALQDAPWDAAVGGDPKTIGAVLKIVDRRCELLGLLPTKGRRRETWRQPAAKRRLWSTQRSSSRKRRGEGRTGRGVWGGGCAVCPRAAAILSSRRKTPRGGSGSHPRGRVVPSSRPGLETRLWACSSPAR